MFSLARGFYDYAGPTAGSRLSRNSRVAFLQSGESRRPGFAFFEAISGLEDSSRVANHSGIAEFR
jgi:hypothetical protein